MRFKIMIVLSLGVLTLSLGQSGCKTTGSKVKVYNAGRLSGWDKDGLKGVIQIKFTLSDGTTSWGSGGLFKNPSDGRIILFTATHVAADFATSPQPIKLYSNGVNLLKTESTKSYELTLSLAPAGIVGTETFTDYDFASILVDQNLYTEEAKNIPSLEMASTAVAEHDVIGFAGYGYSEDGSPDELRFGTNVVTRLDGPQQRIIAFNPKLYGPNAGLGCHSVICSGYRQVEGKPVPVDGAIAAGGDSGSMIFNADKKVVGVVSQGTNYPNILIPETSLGVNAASNRAGAFFKQELAKIGIVYEPGGYDSSNRPLKAKPHAGRSNKLGSAPVLPDPGTIISNETGETIFVGTLDATADSAAAGPGALDRRDGVEPAERSAPTEDDSATPKRGSDTRSRGR